MTHPHTTVHLPSRFVDDSGTVVDAAPIGQLVNAAMDSCAPCQATLLDQVVADHTLVGRLVQLACVAVHNAVGGIPANMLDVDVPGLASMEFRRVARAGLNDAEAALMAEAATLTTAQRRAAADTALNILVGHFTIIRWAQ